MQVALSYATVSETRPIRPVGPLVTSESLIAVISRNFPTVALRSFMSSTNLSLRTISWNRGELLS